MATASKSKSISFKMHNSSRRLTPARACFLLFGASLVATASIQLASANAASSEVWSEADGVHLKYSTNHDDLISTKGSELSLSTDQNQQRHEPASGTQSESESATGSEESAPSEKAGVNSESSEPAGESPAPSSEEEHSGSSEGEQGADSRQNEKIHPSAGKVQSYSSTSQNSFKSSHKAPQPISTYGQQEADESSDSQQPSKLSKANKSRERGFESNEQSDASSSDEGPSSDVPAAVDAENMSGASPSDEHSSKGSYGASKFRKPSRMFKEAVRMNAEVASKESADEELSDDSNEESGEKSPTRPANSDAGESEEPSQHQDDGSRDNDDSLAIREPAKAKSARQNMIDLDQFPSGPLRSSVDVDRGYSPAQDGNPMMMNQFDGPAHPMASLMTDQEDESSASHHFRPPFYDNSVQSSRGSLAASTPHKERVATPPHYTQPRQQTQQQALSSPLPGQQASSASGQKHPQTYKQLSYFKNVKEQQQSSTAPAKPIYSSFRTSAAADEPESPDSVRDNFISPGHFPGSMPHLTQAASEVAADKSDVTQKQETAANSNSPSDSSMPLASSSHATKSVAGEKLEQSSSQQAAVRSEKQEPNSSGADVNKQLKTAESNEIAVLVNVTPVPEAQQESQQIMAPILVSTTTMAPLLATSPTSTSTTSGPTSSQAPSLKRFKFRKYR